MATYVLVHGFWLGGDSWDAVLPPLEAAGHDVVALSLPASPGTTFAEHLAAVTDAIRTASGPVVLVGSSAAGKHVLAASGELPERILATVYVDALPQPTTTSDEHDGDVIAFDWDLLTEQEQRDLTDEQRAWIEQTAVSYPAQVTRDGWELDPRAYEVPALVVGTGFDEATLGEWRRQWPASFTVIDALADLRWAWLPTSHWPQLTRPAELAGLLLATVPA
ncbi:alpha/beta fold hydrolase [Nocardioides jiangxiensis]|uniref:Alpha/beta fold hydrolase n=1 Tax=Nocardioides jiangxiensis TaxID=3064524 RepID=A0ABT9B4P6_9ACTN|nr:alpha/beta fold hydrolase [Nocardioides sp. WY-20]MDO7869370.1 alpha/beta fold hydrolase [Nocardioides sp. WY-20]